MPILFALVGATGVGKSRLSLELAERFNAEIIGVDSLGYLDVEDLSKLTGNDHYCHACFTGKYPTAVPADTRKDRFERRLSE